MVARKFIKEAISEPGELKRFGYDPHASSEKRRASLEQAVLSPRNSGIEVFRKLQLLVNISARRPELQRNYTQDRNFVKERFYGTPEWKPGRA